MTRQITDFNRGTQLIAHFAQMFAAGFKVPLLSAIALYLGLAWYKLHATFSEGQFYLIAMKFYAAMWRFMEFDPAKLVSLRSPYGGTFQLEISQLEEFPSVVRAWDQLVSVLLQSAWLATLIFVPVILLFVWIAARFGKHSKGRRHQRGRKLATTAELIALISKLNAGRKAEELRSAIGRAWRFARRAELVRAGLWFKPFSLVGIPWPWREEQTHAMLIGSTGTGKTVAMMDLLDQIRARGQRSVVFDLTGAYVGTYYDPARDTILHPLDARCPRWSIFDECRNEAEFMAAAEALIPSDGGGEGQFWVQGARLLFANMCKALVEHDMATNEDLATSLMTADVETVYEFVKDTPAAPMSSPDSPKLADSVRAVFNANAQALMYLPKTGRQFSIRDWVCEGKQDGAILFVSARYIDLPVCRQLLTLWLNSAVNTLMSLPTSRTLRLWFLIDELGALHRLPALEAGMRTARNFGGAFVTGVHTQAKLKETYGTNAASELSSLAKTKLILGNPDPETARWCSEIIGNGEVQDMNEGFSFSYNNARDSVNLNPERHEVRIVLPEEIASLDPLNGYICLPGSLPPAPVKIVPITRAVIAEGFSPRSDFELVRGSKRRKGKPALDGKSGADAGQADSASDESGRGNEARIDAAHPPVEPAAGGRLGNRRTVESSDRAQQGILDLQPGLLPAEAAAKDGQVASRNTQNERSEAVGSDGARGVIAGTDAAPNTANPSADPIRESLAAAQGRSRGQRATKRVQRRRAADERNLDAAGGIDRDRGPDLGDFGSD